MILPVISPPAVVQPAPAAMQGAASRTSAAIPRVPQGRDALLSATTDNATPVHTATRTPARAPEIPFRTPAFPPAPAGDRVGTPQPAVPPMPPAYQHQSMVLPWQLTGSAAHSALPLFLSPMTGGTMGSLLGFPKAERKRHLQAR
mmetsp:Transcript_83737/g.167210  ORF Transcript_83737/g.167210 Transcript_83737/m.167210 type:complete len:145 (+) Transcript_83737:237-671(+)